MKRKTSPVSAPKYMWLSFFGIYFIICAAIVPIVSFRFLTSLSFFAIILLCMGLGYFLQTGVSAAFKFKRELESRAYESEYKYFKKKLALPVWVMAFLGSFLINFSVDRLLYERSKLPTYSYDPDSLIPLTVAVVFFITVALGSYVWFFPYSRLMTGSGLMTGLGVLFIIFILHSSIRSPGLVTVGICLICYALCALLSANQYALGRTYRGTVVSFMTPQTRKYNILLSFGLVAVFFGLLFIAYLIVNGLRVCVLFLISALLRSMNNDDAGYTEEEEKSIFDSVSKFIFGTKNASESPDYWMFILFIIAVIVFLSLVLTRRRPELKRFIAWLKALIVSFFEFLWLPIRDFADREEDYFSNYIDEEERLQKHEIQSKQRAETESRMTWHSFSADLRSKRSEEERYRFAYSTFVGQLRRLPFFVRKTDTPRKIKERLSAGGKICSPNEIDRITEAFEQIEYADRPADLQTQEAMKVLCDKIKENM